MGEHTIKRGRGRPPRSANKALTDKARIVSAARELFAEQGYEGVSMRKIACRAECSPAALYQLFPGKRQILHFIWEEVFHDLSLSLYKAYEHNQPQDRLEAVTFSFVDFWLARPDDYRAIFLIEDKPTGSQEAYFVETSQALHGLALIRQTVVEAQERGEIAMADPDEICSILISMAQGLALNFITIPEYPWGDAQSVKTRAFSALFKGLRSIDP